MIASETLRKPNVQEALQAEMAKQGITLELQTLALPAILSCRPVFECHSKTAIFRLCHNMLLNRGSI